MSAHRLRDPIHPASLLRLSEHSTTLVHSLKNKVPADFFGEHPRFRIHSTAALTLDLRPHRR